MIEAAKALMQNEAFVAALADAKKELLDAAMNCTVSDHEGRRTYLGLAKLTDKLATRIVGLATAPDEIPDVEDFYKEQAKNRFKALFT